MRLVILILIFAIAICATIVTIFKTKGGLRAIRKRKNWLKENGTKVKIYFEDCKIIARENIQDVLPDSLPSKIEMLDSLYDQDKNDRQIDASAAILIYEYKYGNHSTQFRSEEITVPSISLQLRLDQKKYTYVYYDPNNPSKYFFDVDFLYNH
jgi:hypothetical protein